MVLYGSRSGLLDSDAVFRSNVNCLGHASIVHSHGEGECLTDLDADRELVMHENISAAEGSCHLGALDEAVSGPSVGGREVFLHNTEVPANNDTSPGKHANSP
jgi:hypothetical protein